MKGWVGIIYLEDLGRDFILGWKQTNLTGDFYDSEIKHFNEDCKSGFLFCGDGWGNFNRILFNKINGLTRMTKGRTFLSFLYTLLKSDYISPSSPVSNRILLQLLLIPLVSIFLLCSKWLKRTAPTKYVDIKYKYFFSNPKRSKGKNIC